MARNFIEILRSDTNEVGEIEVTVTSELHAHDQHKQKEQINRREKTASSGGLDRRSCITKLLARVV